MRKLSEVVYLIYAYAGGVIGGASLSEKWRNRAIILATALILAAGLTWLAVFLWIRRKESIERYRRLN